MNEETEGDIEEDGPCGDLYTPGSETCEWCIFAYECEEDLAIFLKREASRK